jgi:twitching motility protein PilT
MNQLIDLLKEVVRREASDLFITVGLTPMVKVDGVLHALTQYDRMAPNDTEAFSRLLFTREKDYQEFLRNGEIDFSLSLPDVGRFRVNVFRQRGSCAVSLRRIYNEGFRHRSCP